MTSNSIDFKPDTIPEISTATNSAGFDVITPPNISMDNDLVKKMIQILQLENNEERDKIIVDVLKDGRQALAKYKEVFIPEIYSAEMNNTDDHSYGSASEFNDKPTLLKLLKQYVYESWKATCKDQPIIWEFINKIRDENNDHYETVVRHTAEYGTTYTKSSSVLVIVLLLLFQGIDDDCLRNESVFTKLLDSVTREGLKGCYHFKKYISSDDLEEQLSDRDSPLSLSLRMYYCEKVPELLKKYKISDAKQSLYTSAIENVTKDGWVIGIESTKSKIPQVKYEPLLQEIQARFALPQEHELSMSNPTTTTTTTTSSMTTIVETIPPHTNLAAEKDQSKEQINSNLGQVSHPVPSDNNSITSSFAQIRKSLHSAVSVGTPVQPVPGLLTAALSAIMNLELGTNVSNSGPVEKISVFDQYKTTYSYGRVGKTTATSTADKRYLLFIKTINGPPIECEVKSDAKIEDIKARIYELERIPSDKQRLMYGGKQLEDGKTMEEYNIISESTLHLAIRLYATGTFILDPASLDPQHDYDFTHITVDNESHVRGGVIYIRPCGYKRFALNVSNKYKDLLWLDCNNCTGEWPVSYHGTGYHENKTLAQEGYALTQGQQCSFPRGIYSTPHIHLAEKYAKKFTYNNEDYLVIFQNRVNPANLLKFQAAREGTGDYWVSPSEEDVRPYGICIRKVQNKAVH